MLGIKSEASMRAQAAPHLAAGEELRQVFQGTVNRAGGLLADSRIFAVTEGRVLVLDKRDTVIAELPRSVKFIPARAGRFHLDAASGGLAGINYFTETFTLPAYHERVRFGFKSFGAMLAADGREGEKHGHYGKARILH